MLLLAAASRVTRSWLSVFICKMGIIVATLGGLFQGLKELASLRASARRWRKARAMPGDSWDWASSLAVPLLRSGFSSYL